MLYFLLNVDWSRKYVFQIVEKLISNNKEYMLESNTIVYTKVDTKEYMASNLDEILKNNDITNITGYMDKEENLGGKIL